MNQLLLGWVLFLSFWGILLCRIDKRKALQKQWRIPEMTFFIVAFCGGAIGIRVGMTLCHHKTRKQSFYRIINFAVVLETILLIKALF